MDTFLKKVMLWVFSRNSFQLGVFGVFLGIAAVLPTSSVHGAGDVAFSERRIIQVGGRREIRSISVAAKIAKDGDTIEVDAGEYPHDVAVWSQNNLTLRAVGGRVRLLADGASAEGKAIWVVRGGAMTVEGFDFQGARVNDRNGAGIRLEKGRLKVRDCQFIDNENGILTGGGPDTTLDIENSEFGNNGAGDGRSHNLYVGPIARLTVTGSYFHHARVGHLLKSRAAVNDIRYNRFTDEIGGRASYELEFPNGGVAYVIGNVVQQSSTTQNPNIVSFGAENYQGAKNEIYLVNNTLVDLRPQNGVFLNVRPGKVKILAINNLLIGKATLDSAGQGGDYRNNFNVDYDEFVKATREDFRLAGNSRLIGKALLPDAAGEVELKPLMEYVHPRATRRLGNLRLSPGAMQSTGP